MNRERKLMDCQINKSVPIPLYYQLKEFIIKDINSGTLKIGDAIPTEVELSAKFNISRTTVRQAIIELVRDGYLIRRQGKGTFVSKPKISQEFLSKVESFQQQIERLGMKPSTKVLKIEIAEATDEVTKNLKVSPGEKVILLKRLRFADEEPIVIVNTVLPYNKCSFLLDVDLKITSLYKAIDKFTNSKICRCRRIVEAITAGKYESNLLNIDVGSPIQLTTTIGYNQFDEPLEYSVAYYRGDRNKFVVDVQVID